MAMAHRRRQTPTLDICKIYAVGIHSFAMPSYARTSAKRKLHRSDNKACECQLWAVHVIRRQGLIITDAAPCTFVREGQKD
jgi:hypothetical protein